jgi:hypothetical protein
LTQHHLIDLMCETGEADAARPRADGEAKETGLITPPRGEDEARGEVKTVFAAPVAALAAAGTVCVRTTVGIGVPLCELRVASYEASVAALVSSCCAGTLVECGAVLGPGVCVRGVLVVADATAENPKDGI